MNFLLLLVLISSAWANVITIGPGVEKDGKKYFLQFPECKSAFYLGDDFEIESINLKPDWKTRFDQSKKLLTPVIKGFVMIKDLSTPLQTDLSEEIELLKQGESGNNRKLYDKCLTTPEIKLLSGEKMEVDMLKDEYGSIKLTTSGSKIFMVIDLNPLVEEHDAFLRKLLHHQRSQFQLKLSSLQEIASCRLESSYEFMARFKDVVYYDQICRDTKVCKKYWFVTECWEEYKCHHIPHTKRVFVESLLKDTTKLELSTRPGSEETRDYLIEQCLDGFIVSNFMSRKTQQYADGSLVKMDTLLKEYKETYSYQTSVIEAYPIKINLELKTNKVSRQQMENVYSLDKFNCFKDEDFVWFPENHDCIKEILK